MIKSFKRFYVDAYCAIYMMYMPISKRPQDGAAALLSFVIGLYLVSLVMILGEICRTDFLAGNAMLMLLPAFLVIYIFNFSFLRSHVSDERIQKYREGNRNKNILRLFFVLPVFLLLAAWFPALWLPVSMW